MARTVDLKEKLFQNLSVNKIMINDASFQQYGNDPLFMQAINSNAVNSPKNDVEKFNSAISRDAALYFSKQQSPRNKDTFSVRVYDNWLDPPVEPPLGQHSNRVGVSTLLPQKQRFTVQVNKKWT